MPSSITSAFTPGSLPAHAGHDYEQKTIANAQAKAKANAESACNRNSQQNQSNGQQATSKQSQNSKKVQSTNPSGVQQPQKTQQSSNGNKKNNSPSSNPKNSKEPQEHQAGKTETTSSSNSSGPISIENIVNTYFSGLRLQDYCSNGDNELLAGAKSMLLESINEKFPKLEEALNGKQSKNANEVPPQVAVQEQQAKPQDQQAKPQEQQADTQGQQAKPQGQQAKPQGQQAKPQGPHQENSQGPQQEKQGQQTKANSQGQQANSQGGGKQKKRHNIRGGSDEPADSPKSQATSTQTNNNNAQDFTNVVKELIENKDKSDVFVKILIGHFVTVLPSSDLCTDLTGKKLLALILQGPQKAQNSITPQAQSPGPQNDQPPQAQASQDPPQDPPPQAQSSQAQAKTPQETQAKEPQKAGAPHVHYHGKLYKVRYDKKTKKPYLYSKSHGFVNIHFGKNGGIRFRRVAVKINDR
jgi:hypothetical protein